DHVDEAARQIWFRGSGRHADQDPYFMHYYRINFDGSGLVALTEADANHSLVYSADMSYHVVTRSRVDLPPVMELRRTANLELLLQVEAADISMLEEAGWRAPESFVAKGRDGVTDIYGIIVRPTDFDSTRRYPVIESIYAGPQDSSVPKSFFVYSEMRALAELGFIVVQIDGMGTSNRSKAFHDVAYMQLHDSGFPDRILWHRAVAARYSHYDISNVGIYGGSAGGYASTAALLHHPEFYKVAVSGNGNHDHRMDKISFNELFMGWPIGPQYAASSNVDNAWRLTGKLFLLVGEMDHNVDPASTYQVVDALMRANRTFDLLVLPGGGHGTSGDFPRRARYDYFVEHVLGEEPPNWNHEDLGAFPGLNRRFANPYVGSSLEDDR
ncbi:MAG: peptidase S9, partial [Gammaproteobacteria bacterium]